MPIKVSKNFIRSVSYQSGTAISTAMKTTTECFQQCAMKLRDNRAGCLLTINGCKAQFRKKVHAEMQFLVYSNEWQFNNENR